MGAYYTSTAYRPTVGATLVVARGGRWRPPDQRDGTSPSPTSAFPARLVGAALVVARIGTATATATGRDKPVPYGPAFRLLRGTGINAGVVAW